MLRPGVRVPLSPPLKKPRYSGLFAALRAFAIQKGYIKKPSILGISQIFQKEIAKSGYDPFAVLLTVIDEHGIIITYLCGR